MNLNQKKYYLDCCHDISMTTSTQCMLYDYNNNNFYGENFHLKCPLYKKGCKWANDMSIGAYEAERWDGEYIFSCNRGLIFIVVSIFDKSSQIIGALINGPFLIGDRESALFLLKEGGKEDINKVPSINGEIANSYKNLWKMICNTQSNDIIANPSISSINIMYNEENNYTETIKKENKLSRYIVNGERNNAIKVLHQLIENIQNKAAGRREYILIRLRELLNVISRGIIECGISVEAIAEKNEESIEILKRLDSEEELYLWIRDILQKYMDMFFENKSALHKRIIIKVTNYVNENYTKKLTLEDMASQVYVSRSHLCKILKEEFNCTFIEYVNKVRVNKSCNLLEDDAIPISNIASMVGFCDQSYYTKVFKKEIGVSPKRYRMQYLSLNIG